MNAPETEISNETATATDGEKITTYEELCELYGKPGKKKADLCDTVCAITAFAAMLLMFLLTLFCYSRSVIILGGNRIYGDTVNCFTFAEQKYNRIVALFSDLDNSSHPENAYKLFGGVQDIFALGITVVALFVQIIFIIVSIVKLVGRQTDSVLKLLLRAIICNGYIYLVFGYVCNTSGGEGDSYFYIGDAAGVGMTVGVFIAMGILTLCLVLPTVKNGSKIKENRLVKQVASNFVNLVFCAAILCVLSRIPLSRALTYALNSALSSVIAAIVTNSFSFQSLMFSLLNLLVIVLPFTSFNLCAAYSVSELRMTLHPVKEEELTAEYSPKKKKKKNKKPYRLAILFAICFISTMLLRVPQIGLGWSCNVLPYFISLLAVSVIWCTVYTVLSVKAKQPQ